MNFATSRNWWFQQKMFGIQRMDKSSQVSHFQMAPVRPNKSLSLVEYFIWSVVGQHVGIQCVTSFVSISMAQIDLKDELVVSAEMHGQSSGAVMGIRHFFAANSEVSIWARSALKAFFPEIYIKMAQAFETAAWYLDEDLSGFLGHAYVFKMQGEAHLDTNDYPLWPTMTIPAGFFSGGFLYLPDLKLKFQ